MDAWKVKVEVLAEFGDRVIKRREAAEHQIALAQGARSEAATTAQRLHTYLSATVESEEDMAVAEKIRDALIGFLGHLDARKVELDRAVSLHAARATVLKEMVDEIATDVRMTMDAIEKKAAFDALPEDEKKEVKRPAGAKPVKGKVAQARKARASKAKEDDGADKG